MHGVHDWCAALAVMGVCAEVLLAGLWQPDLCDGAVRSLHCGAVHACSALGAGTASAASQSVACSIGHSQRPANCFFPAAAVLCRVPAVVKDVEQQFKYTQPVICPNATCGNT